MFQILLELHKNKTLLEMVKRGLVSPVVLHQLEVYMWIDARMTADKTLTKTQAVLRASVEFDRPQRYIWRCLKSIH